MYIVNLLATCDVAAVEVNTLFAHLLQNVGCDNKFVGARADKCGVCGGDGTSCSQHRNTYSRQNLMNGERWVDHCMYRCVT